MASSSSKSAAKQILRELRKDREGQEVWRACGDEEDACLRACVSQSETSETSETLHQDLANVMSIALEAIKSVHHSKVQRKWRRLYTDACILIAISSILEEDLIDVDRRAVIMTTIRDLDMAIIICGAPGQDRLEYIHRLIAILQEEVSSPDSSSSSSASCADVKSDEIPTQKSFCLASNPIKELSHLPGLTDFLQKSTTEPFIIRSYAKNWPALADPRRRWSDAGYLARVAGRGRVVPVEIGDQYTESDWYQDIVSWEVFLEASGWNILDENGKEDAKRKPNYLAQHNLFTQFPELEKDIVIPEIVYSCPPAPSYYEDYRPPLDEDGLETALTNAWIGPQGTTTPAHYDSYFNAYAQVVGYKLVWIAPPDLLSRHDSSLIDGNSSTLPIFDEALCDELAHADHISNRATSAVLGPGDLLLLPPAWYHAMRSVTRSFSVSIWY
ncbi:hypothetical protein CBS101457_003633 [Exobasidium rhododendri]|nr:hypothetical protein CBS101457_003633 [Exobasidium rhododendri]